LAVLDALERAPLTADQVAEACGLRVQAAAALLSELEIEGLVSAGGAGTYRRRRV
jgi:predicted Rossmann fold nucleotide-binding protein DprA/Smf involved in DNA uptake